MQAYITLREERWLPWQLVLGARECLTCLLRPLPPHPQLPQVVPSTAIAFTVYDYMKAHLDLPTNL